MRFRSTFKLHRIKLVYLKTFINGHTQKSYPSICRSFVNVTTKPYKSYRCQNEPSYFSIYQPIRYAITPHHEDMSIVKSSWISKSVIKKNGDQGDFTNRKRKHVQWLTLYLNYKEQLHQNWKWCIVLSMNGFADLLSKSTQKGRELIDLRPTLHKKYPFIPSWQRSDRSSPWLISPVFHMHCLRIRFARDSSLLWTKVQLCLIK